jgi:two-component system, chemotaxis family, chemotaxis protein CheY
MPVDKNMPILIIDDYKTMLKIVRGLLNQLGFNNIDEASDGSMAWNMMQEKPYKLLLCDWNMEPMNGLDLLKKIRADAKFKAMPFIMVTAETKSENILIAKQAGVNNYIVKPFNLATLKTKMSAVIGAF